MKAYGQSQMDRDPEEAPENVGGITHPSLAWGCQEELEDMAEETDLYVTSFNLLSAQCRIGKSPGNEWMDNFKTNSCLKWSLC